MILWDVTSGASSAPLSSARPSPCSALRSVLMEPGWPRVGGTSRRPVSWSCGTSQSGVAMDSGRSGETASSSRPDARIQHGRQDVDVGQLRRSDGPVGGRDADPAEQLPRSAVHQLGVPSRRYVASRRGRSGLGCAGSSTTRSDSSCGTWRRASTGRRASRRDDTFAVSSSVPTTSWPPALSTAG